MTLIVARHSWVYIMLEKYETPEVESVEMEEEDVIVASCDYGNGWMGSKCRQKGG